MKKFWKSCSGIDGGGKTEVDIDIRLFLGTSGCCFSSEAEAGLETSSLLTKSLTEEFLCLRLARVATPRLKLFSLNLIRAANSKAEDCRLTWLLPRPFDGKSFDGISKAEDCLRMEDR